MQEALDIADRRAIGEERDTSGAQHDGVRLPECPAGVVGRLTQVRRTRLGPEMRPEVLDHLVACEAAAVSEGQQRHKLLRAARRPIGLDDLAGAEQHTETPQHLDSNVVWRWLHVAKPSCRWPAVDDPSS